MKKIFKKIKLRDLIFFIIGGVIFGSVGVFATTYVLQANEIEYKNNKSVQEAIEELYTMAQNSVGSNQTLPIGDVNVVGAQIIIPYTGSYDKATCIYGTTENYENVGTLTNNTCVFTGKSNTKYYYKLIATKLENKTGTVYEYSGSATTSGEKKLITIGLPVGVKAIAYLDPTNLSKYCVESTSTSTTGTKSGCMKWYVFSEDNTSYTMILDHNTTASVAWNSSGHTSGGLKEVQTELDYLENITGWEVTPRLITGQEVADITKNPSWNSSSSYFYFDTNCSPTCNIGTNKYHWLFDYTGAEGYQCTSYGCKIASSSTKGYWTSTPCFSNMAWVVDHFGRMYYYGVKNMNIGLRPVITVSKSNF